MKRNSLVSCAAQALVVTILLAAVTGAVAQTALTGQVSGTVTDPQGAAIPHAKVLLNSTSGVRREAATGDAGDYFLTLVPAGAYTLTVSAPGFRTIDLTDVSVRITETTRLDVALVIASTSETVTVSAAPSLVQAESPVNGRVVDAATVSELPLATRNFTQILSLSTGTATYLPDNTAVGRNSQNISVNGSRVTWNNFQINGIDSNSMGTNSAPSLSIPAPETIEEFKVQTSMYDASYGSSAGGNVQAVTKSGSNNFHGSVYEYFRNNALNANDPILKFAGVPRPVLRRNVYGATFGGPLKKDKTFFFGSYQGTREANAASRINSQSSNVLIAPGLTDDRSAARLLATYGGTVGTYGAVTSINPIALALLNEKLSNGKYLIPTPNTASGRYSGAAPSIYHEEQFNANIDHHFSDSDRLSAKFFFMNAPSTLVLPSFLGGGPNVPGFGNFQQNNGRIASVQETHIFTPRTVNEVRVGYSFLRVDAFPQEPVKDSDIGITRSNASLLPGLGLIQIAPAAGGIVTGTSATIDVKAVSPAATLYEAVSMVRGKHNLRVGGEFRYNQNNYNLNFFTRGQIQFLSFADFLSGNAFVSVFGSGIGNRRLIAPDYNFFIQDDWKIARKLTLNLGLRYELDLPPTDTQGRISTFDPALYKPQLVGPGGPPAAGFVIAGNAKTVPAGFTKVGDRVVKSIDPNNFAPRIGFAWSPFSSGKAAVRGGYGLYYSRSSFQYITLNVIAPPTYVFGTRVGLPAPIPFANPYFAAPDKSQFPTLVPNVALSGTLFDRNLRTPYVQQWNLGVQYAVAQHTMLDVGYVGAHGLDLFRQVAINQAPLVAAGSSITNPVTGTVVTTNTPGNAADRKPFQGVGISNFFQNQTTGQSNYNSLQASLTQRMSHGVQFLASYTWSKSIDNASGQGGGAGVGGVLNPGSVGETSTILGNQLDPRANRGISDFDRTHRFVLSYLIDIPKPGIVNSNTAARALLADWHLSGITTWMAGLPIDVVDTSGGSLYGLNSAALTRPNLVANPMAGVPAGYYFNPQAFQRAVVTAGATIPSSGGKAVAGAAGTDIGTLGRNALRGPRQSNLDFSLIKRFSVTERSVVEFRTDFFNLFNHVNYANPISDLNTVAAAQFDATGHVTALPASFGKIIAASSNPRLIQFALKVSF